MVSLCCPSEHLGADGEFFVDPTGILGFHDLVLNIVEGDYHLVFSQTSSSCNGWLDKRGGVDASKVS